MNKNRKLKRHIAAALFCICGLLFTGLKAEAADVKAEKGVTVNGTDVSGMTAAEIRALGEAYTNELSQMVITLQTEDGSEQEITPAEVGFEWTNPEIAVEAAAYGKKGNLVQRYKAKQTLKRQGTDFPMTFNADIETATILLTELASRTDRKAVDNTLTRENGAFKMIAGSTGYKLDVDGSAEALIAYLAAGWDHAPGSFALVQEVDVPRGDEASLLSITDVLGTYTTDYKTSGASRSQNVKNGCRLMSGHTLYPGDQISMLEMVTPFTVGNGYEMAGSYLNGQVVDSLGGGICQVATTLYNAVIRAELQIDERYNHSMIVGYVKPSMDAAISESGGKDLKITNNTDHPIYIDGSCQDKKITFTVYGIETRSSGHQVSYESEVLETKVPETEKIIASASLPVGHVDVQSVHVGYKARLWKIVKEDGVEVSREVFNTSNYMAVPRTATVGVATGDPAAAEQINAAIATGSIDHVRAVAAALAAQAQAQAQAQG